MKKIITYNKENQIMINDIKKIIITYQTGIKIILNDETEKHYWGLVNVDRADLNEKYEWVGFPKKEEEEEEKKKKWWQW